MNEVWSQWEPISQNLSLLFLVLSAVLHLLYAVGIAKDIGNLSKKHIQPLFLPGIAWVFAALVGGIFTLLVYWLMHHSSLTRK